MRCVLKSFVINGKIVCFVLHLIFVEASVLIVPLMVISFCMFHFQEVLVRFSGFGPAEDEWVNVQKNVRPRSLPCESSECVAVLPGDLILCFQVEVAVT